MEELVPSSSKRRSISGRESSACIRVRKNLITVSIIKLNPYNDCRSYIQRLYDKVYFLSTEEAVKKFAFNPRRYLIPDMPTSPIKFFVIGHPLAGKTLFAHELATLSGGRVIDMKRQTRKCLECVKQRFLFKTRFEATMEAKKNINKKNYEEWKRQERLRREKIHKWIAVRRISTLYCVSKFSPENT